MMESLIKAMLVVSAILGVWLLVQWTWIRITGAAPGQDALAGRLGCHGCDCQSQCESKNNNQRPSGN